MNESNNQTIKQASLDTLRCVAEERSISSTMGAMVRGFEDRVTRNAMQCKAIQRNATHRLVPARNENGGPCHVVSCRVCHEDTKRTGPPTPDGERRPNGSKEDSPTPDRIANNNNNNNNGGSKKNPNLLLGLHCARSRSKYYLAINFIFGGFEYYTYSIIHELNRHNLE
eukprot:jgi/Psemu1/315076/fgenesh1_kg.1860_\